MFAMFCEQTVWFQRVFFNTFLLLLFPVHKTKGGGEEDWGGVSCVQPKPSKLNAQENSKRINASVKV